MLTDGRIFVHVAVFALSAQRSDTMFSFGNQNHGTQKLLSALFRVIRTYYAYTALPPSTILIKRTGQRGNLAPSCSPSAPSIIP